MIVGPVPKKVGPMDILSMAGNNCVESTKLLYLKQLFWNSACLRQLMMRKWGLSWRLFLDEAKDWNKESKKKPILITNDS